MHAGQYWVLKVKCLHCIHLVNLHVVWLDRLKKRPAAWIEGSSHGQSPNWFNTQGLKIN